MFQFTARENYILSSTPQPVLIQIKKTFEHRKWIFLKVTRDDDESDLLEYDVLAWTPASVRNDQPSYTAVKYKRKDAALIKSVNGAFAIPGDLVIDWFDWSPARFRVGSVPVDDRLEAEAGGTTGEVTVRENTKEKYLLFDDSSNTEETVLTYTPADDLPSDFAIYAEVTPIQDDKQFNIRIGGSAGVAEYEILFQFEDDGHIYLNGVDKGTYSAGVRYGISLTVDQTAQEVTGEVNGVSIGTESFAQALYDCEILEYFTEDTAILGKFRLHQFFVYESGYEGVEAEAFDVISLEGSIAKFLGAYSIMVDECRMIAGYLRDAFFVLQSNSVLDDHAESVKWTEKQTLHYTKYRQIVAIFHRYFKAHIPDVKDVAAMLFGDTVAGDVKVTEDWRNEWIVQVPEPTTGDYILQSLEAADLAIFEEVMDRLKPAGTNVTIGTYILVIEADPWGTGYPYDEIVEGGSHLFPTDQWQMVYDDPTCRYDNSTYDNPEDGIDIYLT